MPPAVRPSQSPRAGTSWRLARADKKRQASSKRSPHSVAILVNDEPITRHEINQRARLMSMTSNIGKQAQANFKALVKRKDTNDRLRAILKQTIEANRGKSREQILAIFEKKKRNYAKSLQQRAVASARAGAIPAFRRKATKELIEERLKMQEAKRLKVLASTADVDASIQQVAQRNKMSSKQFLANIGRSGANPNTYRDKLRAQISWIRVIRRRFSQTISVNLKDIDQHIATGVVQSDVTLRIQTITISLPSNFDQASMAKRLREAETLQSKFSGCNTTRLLAKQLQGATFSDVGNISAKKISEPARSLLTQARDGEMIPPITTTKGIVLYAVCGRNAQAGKDNARDQARSALRQREFQIMGQRHLADLKRDAHIEYR